MSRSTTTRTRPRTRNDRVRELEQELERERAVSRALREVGLALGSTLDLDDLLELILDKLTLVVGADRATLYLLDEARAELVSRVVVGQEVRSIRVRLGHGIAGTVAQTGKPIRLGDAYRDGRFEPEWDALTGYRTRSILAVPLKNHLGRTIGVLQVLNQKTRGEFTQGDEDLVMALSTQAAVAIDNSRLFLTQGQKNRQLLQTTEQLERALRHQGILLELERATGRARSLEELLSVGLEQLLQATMASGAVLLLADEETGNLVHHARAAGGGELSSFGVKAGEGLLERCRLSGAPLELPDARRDPAWSSSVEGRIAFLAESSFLAVPLEGGEEAIGAVGVAREPNRAFAEEERSIAQLVAANLSTAIRLFRASRAQERSERLTTIGRLLSQVVHDFRTPLAVISGYLQLMTDTDEREQREEYQEEALRQFDHLEAMQREVLEFARGERRVFVRRILLRKFFGDLSRTLRHELEGKAVELALDVDTRAVARFDETRVARAMHNLVRNAVEAMGSSGGRLTLRGRLEGGELVLQVSDTGPGIPPEIEDRLFQSFVTMGKQSGTGLGLAIVKKIAEEHGGRVEVRSSPQGATFTLRLPANPAPASERAPRSTRAKGVAP